VRPPQDQSEQVAYFVCRHPAALAHRLVVASDLGFHDTGQPEAPGQARRQVLVLEHLARTVVRAYRLEQYEWEQRSNQRGGTIGRTLAFDLSHCLTYRSGG